MVSKKTLKSGECKGIFLPHLSNNDRLGISDICKCGDDIQKSIRIENPDSQLRAKDSLAEGSPSPATPPPTARHRRINGDAKMVTLLWRHHIVKSERLPHCKESITGLFPLR
jgi:hypothetical protein